MGNKVTVTRESGATQDVLSALTSNADKPFTLAELADMTGRARTSTSSAVTRLQRKFPLQLEIKSRGIYVWHSQEMKTPKIRSDTKTDFMLEVIEEREGRWLAKDVVTGKLYMVKELDW